MMQNNGDWAIEMKAFINAPLIDLEKIIQQFEHRPERLWGEAKNREMSGFCYEYFRTSQFIEFATHDVISRMHKAMKVIREAKLDAEYFELIFTPKNSQETVTFHISDECYRLALIVANEKPLSIVPDVYKYTYRK